MWGGDYNQYNTIVFESSCCLPFWALQLFRMIAFLILLPTSSFFFYIFVKRTVQHFCMIPLFYSLFAFYFLFIGSGK